MSARNDAESFWRRTRESGACVVWTGYLNQDGYGKLKWSGYGRYAHRVAFFLRMGRWPESELRHLCNDRSCVLHVVEGSRSENVQDTLAAGNHPNASRTHCKHGHEFTEENTRIDKAGRRVCKVCSRARVRVSAKRRRDAERANAVAACPHDRMRQPRRFGPLRCPDCRSWFHPAICHDESGVIDCSCGFEEYISLPEARGDQCAVDGCESPVRTRGWCIAHYERWRWTGSPTGSRRNAA